MSNSESKNNTESYLRFMTKEMIEADTYHQKNSTTTPAPLFGTEQRFYLPAHGDMNCPCNQCTTYRISRGTQPIIRITLPAIKPRTDS